MDEHLSVLSGETIDMKNQFVDDNRMPIGLFIDKHNGYATREAALLLDAEYHLTNMDSLPQDYGREVEKKRTQKARYARMPLFWRAFGYFVYRYIIKLGFWMVRKVFFGIFCKAGGTVPLWMPRYMK